MILYLAGPMTGHNEYNYPAFQEAAKELRAAGYEVLNPADTESERDFDPSERTWSWYMRHAIAKLVQCDGIALMNGWQTSRGALIEYNLARELGIQAHHVPVWIRKAEETPPSERIEP